MKTFLAFIYFILFTFIFGGCTNGELLEIKENPSAGFNYPYLLFIPENISLSDSSYLLVLPNNTGTVSDDLSVHYEAAKNKALHSFVGNKVSAKLKAPLLVPVFPREETRWKIYTHALDRDAIQLDAGKMSRIDLQLLSMIKDAKQKLLSHKIMVKEKILLNGFSASGTFANRFTFLYPGKVKAVAAGGINGLLILPVDSIQNAELNYPLGVNNYEEITGKQFSYETIEKVDQFYYMGIKDSNDATFFSDGYDDDEQKIVHQYIGKKMLSERWAECQNIYLKEELKVKFKTYSSVGHEITEVIKTDVLTFFKESITENKSHKLN